jgi:predicted DNA-binding transcriptional regulator AlpA
MELQQERRSMEHYRVSNPHDAPLLNDVQAAAYLSLSPSTLRRWRSEGRGRGPAWLKLGGRVRYSLADLEAYKDACRYNARG